MKKMFEIITNTVSLNAESVSNKTHWFVYAVDTALKMIGINNAVFSYSSSPQRLTMTIVEKTFEIQVPTISRSPYDAGDKYLMYVNSDEKVIFGLGSLGRTYNIENTRAQSADYPINYVRGFLTYSSTGSGNAPFINIGGYFSLKISNGTAKCFSDKQYAIGTYTTSTPTSNLIGIVLPSNYKAENTPIVPVNIRYQKVPVLDSFIGNPRQYNLASFEGEYINSVFICQQFYLGSMKTADNKKFVYGGYMFDVENATDIGTINPPI